ncbi:MAG: hypothetical protein JWN63_1053 [Candidatus Acidoferrum typicum]|nr:hypothetical protein [Candidatus Acidoferrum typicum]
MLGPRCIGLSVTPLVSRYMSPKSLYFSKRGHPLYGELETAYGRAGLLAPSLLVRAHGAIILPSARSNNPFLGERR